MRRVPDKRAGAQVASTPERGERGAVIVELALILPFLVILLLGIMDMGMLLREHQLVQNAAREGARLSILPQNLVGPCNPTANLSTIKQRVVDYMAQSNITITTDQVSINQAFPITVGSVTEYGSQVTVTYTRSLLIPAGGYLPFGSVSLKGTAVFRNLYGNC